MSNCADAIAADVAFRDAHAPQPNAHVDKPFGFVVDGRVYSDRVEAAAAFAAVIERGLDESFAAGQATGSCASMSNGARVGQHLVAIRPQMACVDLVPCPPVGPARLKPVE